MTRLFPFIAQLHDKGGTQGPNGEHQYSEGSHHTTSSERAADPMLPEFAQYWSGPWFTFNYSVKLEHSICKLED